MVSKSWFGVGAITAMGPSQTADGLHSITRSITPISGVAKGGTEGDMSPLLRFRTIFLNHLKSKRFFKEGRGDVIPKPVYFLICIFRFRI